MGMQVANTEYIYRGRVEIEGVYLPYTSTLYMMVDVVKGGGRTSPPGTRLGWFFHHDGMYVRKRPLPLCVYSVVSHTDHYCSEPVFVTARQRLAKSISRNRFLGSLNVYKYGLCLLPGAGVIMYSRADVCSDSGAKNFFWIKTLRRMWEMRSVVAGIFTRNLSPCPPHWLAQLI